MLQQDTLTSSDGRQSQTKYVYLNDMSLNLARVNFGEYIRCAPFFIPLQTDKWQFFLCVGASVDEQ